MLAGTYRQDLGGDLYAEHVIHVGVVSDVRRADRGQALADQVRADLLTADDGTLGCTGNHALMWGELARNPAEWNVVLEDDAEPVKGFRDQLAAALAVAPCPIVSLYLGTGYINDNRTAVLLGQAAQVGAQWLVGNAVLHAVALAVRGDLVPSLVAHALPAAGRQVATPIDRALATWARRNSLGVAYSIPSLVDHADVPSLVTQYRRAPRRAWHAGTRDAWNNKTMLMT